MSFWSKLKKIGKIAAPIALGVATGGMSLPAQIGLGAALGGGMNAKKGVKGILKGAALGGGTSALGGSLGKVTSKLKLPGGASRGVSGAEYTAKGTGGIGSKITGGLGKVFGGDKPMVDPMMAAMLGLSMIGGDEGGGDSMRSFDAPGQITDPTQHMYQQLSSIYRLGQGLSEGGPVRMRSSYVPAPPAPVNIEGIPFQIGGGLGVDPALKDPSLLEADDRGANKYDPFQSIAQEQFAAAQAPKLRKPSNV